MISTSIYLDKRTKLKTGKYSVKLRITARRESKYYPTGIKLFEHDFIKIQTKPTGELKEIALKLKAFEVKAKDCIDKLPIFTYELFERLYCKNKGATDYIKNLYEEYISDLVIQNRYGTASSYKTSLNSLLTFKPKLKLVDITPTFLKSFEKYMLDKKCTYTTIGFYLRPLKAIFNTAIANGLIDVSLYPFGKRKYQVPSSKSNKRALNATDIAKLLNYKTECRKQQFALDIWTFSYYCNGINATDMFNLKVKNIVGNTITFIREKTKNTKKNSFTTAYINSDMLDIIKKYCSNINNSDEFIFPILHNDMDGNNKRNKTKKYIKYINKHLKAIQEILGIDLKLTTYTARHSFATTLNTQNVPIQTISELLNHSNIKTTQNYIASLQDSKLQEVSNLLVRKQNV